MITPGADRAGDPTTRWYIQARAMLSLTAPPAGVAVSLHISCHCCSVQEFREGQGAPSVVVDETFTGVDRVGDAGDRCPHGGPMVIGAQRLPAPGTLQRR